MSDVETDSAEKRLKIVLVGDSGAGKDPSLDQHRPEILQQRFHQTVRTYRGHRLLPQKHHYRLLQEC